MFESTKIQFRTLKMVSDSKLHLVGTGNWEVVNKSGQFLILFKIFRKHQKIIITEHQFLTKLICILVVIDCFKD